MGQPLPAPAPPPQSLEHAGLTAGGDACGLKPVLRTFPATMMVMGCMVGAGIFFTPRQVAVEMQSLTGVVGVWVLGGGIALCGALVFAELGGTLPQVGGQYAFLRRGCGKFVAFLFGWSMLATVTSGAIAAVALIFVDHLQAFLEPGTQASLPPWMRTSIALGLIVLLTLLNIRGVRIGARVQNLAMVAKVLGILTVVLLGVWHALGGASTGEAAPAAAAAAPPARGGIAAWLTALLPAAFSYGGFQNVSAVAPEIHHPQRTIPLATLVGTAAVVVLYVSVNWSVASILGVSGMMASPTPVASAAGAVWQGGERFIALLVLISTFGITQALLMVMPRIFYAMALDGVFLPVAGRVHPRYRTPAAAIALLGAFSAVHVLLGKHLDLLQMAVLVDWVFFTLCAVTLFVLRVREPERPRPYRAHGYPLLPFLFLVFGVAIVVNSLWNAERIAVQRALLLLAVGVVLYFSWARRQTLPRS